MAFISENSSSSRSAMQNHIKHYVIEPYHINQGYTTVSTVNVNHTGHSISVHLDVSVDQLTQFLVK
jgi:hypothetical protein